MLILNIESSTDACSVSLTRGADVVLLHGNRLCRLQVSGSEHARLLPLFADELLRLAAADGFRPEAVAVSAGPGSYTGLRIGASFAKGIAFGRELPLVAVPTLQVMAAAARSAFSPLSDVILCPMMDARRMEVYTALYSDSLSEMEGATAQVVTDMFMADILSGKRVAFFGNGMNKCKSILSQHKNALFIEDIVPDAAYMGGLAEQLVEQGNFVDVAYWTPFYLKEFEAKHSVVKGL